MPPARSGSVRVLALFALAVVVAGTLVACSGDDDATSPTTTTDARSSTTAPAAGDTTPAVPAYTSPVYADAANWLCRPDIGDDACDVPLTTAVVQADGTTTIETLEVAEDPPVDCFYVYPTISTDDSPNSDLVPGPEERGVAVAQAARFASECRLFAPMYRQRTLRALGGALGGAGGSDPADEERIRGIAYADVLDAWNHYLANDNGGRGVVLIGHSQGATVLNRLVREEIDGNPDRRAQLVSAMLIGSSVAVPEGSDVGGDFRAVPACRAPDDTGCVISYASFRSTAPPPADSFFGRPRAGGGVSLCTNPAALGGGPADLADAFGGVLGGSGRAVPGADPEDDPEDERGATYTSYPGLLTGECVVRDGFSYLEITVHGDPADARVDDIPGDLSPQWGLHLVDVSVAYDDLVGLVGTQAAAYDRG